jgi:D-arabinan exo alpha-(1,3)/(1,5)-arabinofuranosidase (non-reducing end)
MRVEENSPATEGTTPIAADPYADLVDLFRLTQPLTGRTGQFSSYDRTGGERDYSWWTFLRAEPRRAVLADVCGPGCISRIWVTAFDPVKARIEIFIDGATTPVVSAAMSSFFGNLPPFTPPLAGPTSGAWVSYVPIPFRRSCRIEAYDAPQFNGQFYYNVTYRTYEAGDAQFESFAMPPTSSQQARITQFAQQYQTRGQDPKGLSPGEMKVTGTLRQVPAGETATLANLPGAGMVTQLLLSVTPNNSDIFANARLRCHWDGIPTGAVDVPLGAFFASGFGPANAEGLPLGTTSGQMYCYFAMPYAAGAIVEVWNGSATAIDSLNFTVAYLPEPAATVSRMRFHAEARAQRPAVGMPYCILDAAGRGHYLGCCLSIHSIDNNWVVLEGDEQIYVDGEATPAVHGTGTEDYFNGGFYFAGGPFSRPFSGCSLLDSGSRRVSAYRLCVTDPVVFHNGITVNIEHGFRNKSIADYQSTAFYYRDDAAGAAPPPPSFPALPEEMLVNGDLEQGFGGYNGGEANGWMAYQSGTYYGYTPCEFSSDTVQTFSGGHALKITVALPTSGFQSAGIAQQVQVTKGATYQVTAQLRINLTGDLKPNDVLARLGVGLAGNTNFEDLQVIWTDAPTATDTWHTVTALVTAENNYLTLFAGGLRKWPSVGGTATVWVDEITLVRTGAMPPAPPPISGLPALSNPSFEFGIEPWEMWVGAGSNADPLERDFGSAVDGSWVLAVKGIGSGGKGAYQYIASNWVAGHTYRLAASARNLRNTGLMYTIGYASGRTGAVEPSNIIWGPPVAGTSAWQVAAVDFTYKGTAGVTFYLRVVNAGSSERGGFDGVTIADLGMSSVAASLPRTAL